ncbi:MAG TPA: VOC family protein [Candidatus Binataceae bacterium]
MFKGIDHIVIVVQQLDEAISSYTRAGFSVVRGGRHPIGTHNALIAFADGAYLELIAFERPQTGHPWQAALDRGGGIIDFCMQTDDLAADADLLRRAGVKISDPSSLTRDRPDGYHLSWVLSIPQPPFSGRVPFLINDDTPRDERVPRERAHKNRVAGIQRVSIAVESPAETSRYYARVLGYPGTPIQRPDLNAAGVEFTVGPHSIQLLAQKAETGPIADWIRARGQCVYEAALKAEAAGRLDRSLLQNANLTIA